MPKFVIEREIPNVGEMSDADLRAAAQRSVKVLNDMGSKIQWLHSYVTGNKIYCVYTRCPRRGDCPGACQENRPSSQPRFRGAQTLSSPSTAE